MCLAYVDRSMPKNISMTGTVLDNARPLTAEQERRLLTKWLNETFDVLLKYADYERSFAERMCIEIVEKFGTDEELSAVISNRIKAARTGKRTGPRRKWGHSRLYLLLVLYKIRLKQGDRRVELLEKLAEMEGYSGVNAIKKIQERIKQANKEIDQNTLPDICR